MKLSKDESVVTAYAQPANGPGWANRPLWVVVRRNGTEEYRMVCLQPHEQTEEMVCLYGIAAQVQGQMTKAAERLLRTRGGGR
jgi:hypothetical protein